MISELYRSKTFYKQLLHMKQNYFSKTIKLLALNSLAVGCANEIRYQVEICADWRKPNVTKINNVVT